MESGLLELQAKLYKRLGVDSVADSLSSQKLGRHQRGQAASRREQRKAQRIQKRTQGLSKHREARYESRPFRDVKPHIQPRAQYQFLTKAKKSSQVVHARGSNGTSSKHTEDEEDDKNGDVDVDVDMDDLTKAENSNMETGSEAEHESDHDEEDDSDDHADVDDAMFDEEAAESNHRISRPVNDKLAQDDADIAAFERKLGIKRGRKSLPQSFQDDGLVDLIGDLGDNTDGSEGNGGKSSHGKKELDDWLAAKRRKAAALPTSNQQHPGDGEKYNSIQSITSTEEDDDEEDGPGDGYENNAYEDSFDGLDSDIAEETISSQPKKRENPYVAPTTGNVVVKYIPPSLRKASETEGEAKTRLRKQVQGLINRLTDANMLSIVYSIEELYQKNARGDVTELLTDVIITQLCKPESLPDQFFVLTGGFAAAVYKLTGSSFGSYLIRRVVQDFSREYDKASTLPKDGSAAIPKEPSNLLAFLSQLYVFEVISCKIIYDYMERLLGEIDELNVEIILRICRMGGRLLRRDDQQALKHISSVLGKAVAKAGYDNISARTKFMVEMINDLKNSKPKARGIESAVVSEHAVRMKRHLGELKSQSRRLDGLAPMGMSLADIEVADSAGKWWLVGASVPVKPEKAKPTEDMGEDGIGGFGNDDEDMDFILPDLSKKARAQGFNKPAQIAIFTALMTAMDYEQGYRNYVNLNLKKDDHLELAPVLVQCVGSEVSYNAYYAQVARKACTNSKIKFALQSRIWQIFRALGESLFGEDADDGDTADSERFQDETRLKNVALFYSSLITQGSSTLTILKPLEIPKVGPQVSSLLQWLLLSILQDCKSKNQEKENANVQKIFGIVKGTPALAAGLHWFLRKKVRKTRLIGPKNIKKLDLVLEKAQEVVGHMGDGGGEV